nr:carboxymuconolactone decarboxylase family protein [Sphingosinicella soli]
MIQPIDPATATPAQAAVLAVTPPINLFRLLVHAPPLAKRIAGLGGAVMDGTIDPILRELVALRVAHRAGAAYVRGQHLRVAELIGMPERLVAAAAEEAADVNAVERDVLALADAVVHRAALEPALQARLIEALGREHTMGLVVTAGYFSMIAGVTNAFSLPLEGEAVA